MKTMKRLAVFCGIFLLVILQLSSAVAGEHDDLDDLRLFGFEAEKLLNLGSGLLATILLGIMLLAYQRTQRKRLVYVCAAFGLFAFKGFLTSAELFFNEWSWVDPVASLLTFLILLAFFAGVAQK